MVQTPHHFYSPDPFERNLNIFRTIPNEGALFYGVVQDGNDLWNATFFCGSCAVIKREALEQIGGIAVETVTEDAHTALRLQRLRLEHGLHRHSAGRRSSHRKPVCTRRAAHPLGARHGADSADRVSALCQRT